MFLACKNMVVFLLTFMKKYDIIKIKMKGKTTL